ncbi:MAG: helix-turn-helix domain-containing protein [Gammaproteobacteria bacterium]|nr:helix-turn-helix domain-containing protein [Gammaproteobacteria bacterium]
MTIDKFIWLDYNRLEGLIKARFGSVSALLDKMNRKAAWYYRARKESTLKVRDLETICAMLDVSPSEMFVEKGNKAEQPRANYSAGISSRVSELVAMLATSQKEFSTKTGVTPTHLSYIVSQGGKPGLRTLQQIIVAYPTLSARWLLLGSGTMMDQGDNAESLARELADKQKIIDLLQTQINLMKG